MVAEVRPEVGRNGLQRHRGCEDGRLSAVFGIDVGPIRFKCFAFEPGYGACFEVLVRAVFEGVADESQTDEVMRVGTKDGGCEVVSMTSKAGRGCVCRYERDGLEVLCERLVVLGFANIIVLQSDEAKG